VSLAEWADIVLIYPASATTISRIAQGDFSDAVSAVAMTTTAPVVVFPSMNGKMFNAPAVRRNLATIREDGFFVVDPGVGLEIAHLPGERTGGTGPTIPVERVVDLVRVILDCGPTRRSEPPTEVE
jgi:phosphopantothenoylcysteine decarboxylase/phosphopantothenate--cysteine ligase